MSAWNPPGRAAPATRQSTVTAVGGVSLALALLGACASGGAGTGTFLPTADAVFDCSRTIGATLSFADAPRDHPLGATIEPQRINLLRWAPEGPWQRATTIDWIAVSVFFVGDSGRARAEAATQRRPRETWDPAPPDVRALADSIQRTCRRTSTGTG